jgi:hypothetical protein
MVSFSLQNKRDGKSYQEDCLDERMPASRHKQNPASFTEQEPTQRQEILRH